MTASSKSFDVIVIGGGHAGCEAASAAARMGAATALAKTNEDDAPHLIYTPERVFDAERFLADAQKCIEKYGWVSVVCGEGLYLALRRERRKLSAFLAGAGLVLVCFAPWVLACARAAGGGRGLAENVGWIERPNGTRPGAS